MKMLVSDYDDTFYINDEDIKRNVFLVNKNRDKYLFIIATGRSYSDYLKKKELYNIESKYVILNHGASILKGEELIYNCEINKDILEKLIFDLDIKMAVKYFACSGKDSRVDINSNNLTKINVEYGNEGITKEKYDELNRKYGKYINLFLVSRNRAIEIVAKLVDKRNAILKLIEIENIKVDKIITVGNGDTDYEMLKYFDGYCMKNSSPKIKKLKLKEVESVSELII